MTSTTTSTDRLERLGRYLVADPDNVALASDYAREAWAAREPEACLQALRRLQQLDALDAEHAGLLGRVLADGGDPAAAVLELEAALQRWPASPALAFELARSQFALGDVEQALLRLPAGSEEPNLAAAMAALRVRLLHHAGRLDEAVAFAESTRPLPLGLEAALLPVLVDLGRMAEAAQRAERLAGAMGEGVPYEVCEPLAIAALDAQGEAQARQWIARALGLRRDDGRIWLLSALAHMQAGETEAATEAAGQAAELMPSHAGSHLTQGWIALLAQDRGAARAAFERGIEADRSFAEGHGSLAVLEAMERHESAAGVLVRKALRLDERCASAQYAQMLLRGGSPAQVQELAQLVLAQARMPRR